RVSAGAMNAFRFSDTTSGVAQSITVYVGAHSRAASVVFGLYADVGGHPAGLLVSGWLARPKSSALDALAGKRTPVRAGHDYWLALLARGGSIVVRVRDKASCKRAVSSSDRLGALPSSKPDTRQSRGCPISAYVGGRTGTTMTPPAAPVNTSRPVIGGMPQQGQTLATTNGSWSNSPTSFAYRSQDHSPISRSCLRRA